MDEMDLDLLNILAADSRTSLRELAGELGMSVTAVRKRLAALARSGVIRGYRTVLDPEVLGATEAMVFGHMDAVDLDGVIERVGRSRYTSEIAVAGGNDLYVRACIDSLDELDEYSAFVARTADMAAPAMGIVHPDRGPGTKDGYLSNLDLRIVDAFRRDSRRNYADAAKELGVSAKTVRRRMERLVSSGMVCRTLDSDLVATHDILALFRVHLKKGADPKRVRAQIVNRFAPTLVQITRFMDISDLILCQFWCRSMMDVRSLHKRLQREQGVAAAVLNIVHSSRSFDNWMDREMQRLARSGEGMGRASPTGRRSQRFGIGSMAKLETYRKALVQALRDGLITHHEEAILRSLRDSLRISEKDHSAIYRMVLREGMRTRKEIEIYRRALARALEDGVINDDEAAILGSLRDSLHLTSDDHDRLMVAMLGGPGEGQRQGKDKRKR